MFIKYFFSFLSIFFIFIATIYAKSSSFEDEDILNDKILLSEAITDYSNIYENNPDFNQSISLQGILYINQEMWTLWINNKEIDHTSPQYIHIDNKIIEILSITPRFIKIKCENEEITLYVGKTYNVRTHTLSSTDF